jgi:hypothetical protein
MRRAAVKAWVHTAVACLALGAAFPVPALAQEAIPTAVGAPGDGAPPAPEDAPLRLSDRIDRGEEFLRPIGPCGGPALTRDGKPDKAPHGEVWAGIGTHGYRDIGGVVCAPLGDKGAVSIAVDAGRIDGWGYHR